MLLARKSKNNPAMILQTIVQKINLAKENLSNNPRYSEILFRSINELLDDLPRL